MAKLIDSTRMKTELHPMASARYCLVHARRHAVQIAHGFSRYIESRPYRVEERRDSSEILSVYLKRTRNPSLSLAATVGDAFEQLRKALDHTAYAIAKSAMPSGKLRQCAFPFGRTEDGARSQLKRNSREIPPEYFETMLAFKPYREDGDPLLWSLNEICNTNKHAMLTTVTSDLGGVAFSNLIMSGTGAFLGPWDEEKGEMLIASLEPSARVSADSLEIKICPVFATVGDVSGQQVERVFQDLVVKVEEILDRLEEQAAEAGLFQKHKITA